MGELIKEGIIYVSKWAFFGVTKYSYVICLFVSLVSIIYYIAGCKKAGKYINYSIVTYIILECLKGLLKE